MVKYYLGSAQAKGLPSLVCADMIGKYGLVIFRLNISGYRNVTAA